MLGPVLSSLDVARKAILPTGSLLIEWLNSLIKCLMGSSATGVLGATAHPSRITTTTSCLVTCMHY